MPVILEVLLALQAQYVCLDAANGSPRTDHPEANAPSEHPVQCLADRACRISAIQKLLETMSYPSE